MFLEVFLALPSGPHQGSTVVQLEVQDSQLVPPLVCPQSSFPK